MNRFFDALGARFQSAASQRGVTMEAPALDPAVAEQLLELARVAAHSQERRFAPLACYVAGMAAERFQASAGAAAGVAALIEQVRAEMEAGAPPSEDPT